MVSIGSFGLEPCESDKLYPKARCRTRVDAALPIPASTITTVPATSIQLRPRLLLRTSTTTKYYHCYYCCAAMTTTTSTTICYYDCCLPVSVYGLRKETAEVVEEQNDEEDLSRRSFRFSKVQGYTVWRRRVCCSLEPLRVWSCGHSNKSLQGQIKLLFYTDCQGRHDHNKASANAKLSRSCALESEHPEGTASCFLILETDVKSWTLQARSPSKPRF